MHEGIQRDVPEHVSGPTEGSRSPDIGAFAGRGSLVHRTGSEVGDCRDIRCLAGKELGRLYQTAFGKPLIITIDGTAGAGKNTLAESLSAYYELPFPDTGAIFRTFAVYLMRAGIDSSERNRIAGMIHEVDLTFECDPKHVPGTPHIPLVMSNSECMNDLIWGANRGAVGMVASAIADIPEVRARYREIIVREAQGACVITGRDVGTRIFPEAPIKIWVDARLEVRAERRALEIMAKEQGVSLATLSVDRSSDMFRAKVAVQLQGLSVRDRQDSSRAQDPLAQPASALCIDTSLLSADDQQKQICEGVDDRLRHLLLKGSSS